MSPEMLNTSRLRPACDVYSFGILRERRPGGGAGGGAAGGGGGRAGRGRWGGWGWIWGGYGGGEEAGGDWVGVRVEMPRPLETNRPEANRVNKLSIVSTSILIVIF
jgi:hypothetical protein